MIKVRSRGEKIRRYILDNVERSPADIAKLTAGEFDISRQAANKHLSQLVKEKTLAEAGNTRNRTYKLCPMAEIEKTYPLTLKLEEDVVWRADIADILAGLPENVVDIWRYCFTEMFNNAIDHSNATYVSADVKRNAASTEINIYDNGIGIFKKIKDALGLLDGRHAVFELSKGKLTTDPANHTGEGIFFSSRMVDRFAIMSSETYFSHSFGAEEEWILEQEGPVRGTHVRMQLSNHTARTTKGVFSEFTSDEHMGFTKTVVPVRLAQYGDDKLVSRSQAKRLLDRVDRFKTVLFDFEGIATIGQSFADEIFRVFALSHPLISLFPINANADVMQVITRAKAGDSPLPTVTSDAK
jgi:anti-sigma regulatory factor (Ser/Thr protein kinase)